MESQDSALIANTSPLALPRQSSLSPCELFVTTGDISQGSVVWKIKGINKDRRPGTLSLPSQNTFSVHGGLLVKTTPLPIPRNLGLHRLIIGASSRSQLKGTGLKILAFVQSPSGQTNPSPQDLWKNIWVPARSARQNCFLWQVSYHTPATNHWRFPGVSRADPATCLSPLPTSSTRGPPPSTMDLPSCCPDLEMDYPFDELCLTR